jgi:hypothetical protein
MKTHAAPTAELEMQLDDLINNHRFTEATHLLNHDEFRQIFKSLVSGEYGELDLDSAYKFCKYAIAENGKDIYWHKMAFQIAHLLAEAKVSFKQRAMVHLLDAITLDSTDWKLKESALTYYDGGVLPEKFVKPFAEIVIRMDPTNQNALKVLENEWD